MGPDEPEAQKLVAEKATDSDAVTKMESAKRVVRTVWPHGDFIIEDVPVVTSAGVELGGAELDRVVEAAKANGVPVVVEGGN
jgi:hypothetical protein